MSLSRILNVCQKTGVNNLLRTNIRSSASLNGQLSLEIVSDSNLQSTRTMATMKPCDPYKRCISIDNINPAIKIMEYAVRGPLVIRAAAIEKELEQVGSLCLLWAMELFKKMCSYYRVLKNHSTMLYVPILAIVMPWDSNHLLLWDRYVWKILLYFLKNCYNFNVLIFKYAIYIFLCCMFCFGNHKIDKFSQWRQILCSVIQYSMFLCWCVKIKRKLHFHEWNSILEAHWLLFIVENFLFVFINIISTIQ